MNHDIGSSFLFLAFFFHFILAPAQLLLGCRSRVLFHVLFHDAASLPMDGNTLGRRLLLALLSEAALHLTQDVSCLVCG